MCGGHPIHEIVGDDDDDDKDSVHIEAAQLDGKNNEGLVRKEATGCTSVNWQKHHYRRGQDNSVHIAPSSQTAEHKSMSSRDVDQ